MDDGLALWSRQPNGRTTSCSACLYNGWNWVAQEEATDKVPSLIQLSRAVAAMHPAGGHFFPLISFSPIQPKREDL